MAFRGVTYAEVYSTPYDDDDPVTGAWSPLVENRIVLGYDSARGPIVQSDYGINLPAVMAAMGRAVQRGIYMVGVFDHTQFAGESEQAAWAAWWTTYPGPWQKRLYVCGSSPEGAGLIDHSKKRVYNAEIEGYTVPDRPFGYYTSLEQALDDGYPVVEFGSLNITTKAGRQVNDVCFMPSRTVAAMFVQDIMANRAWILEHEAQYQPFPAP